MRPLAKSSFYDCALSCLTGGAASPDSN
jgi:hypothetical protein